MSLLPQPSRAALIGSTGLIGSLLDKSHAFTATARSTTVKQLMGKRFDTVFIAAAKGSMLEANKFPDRDAAHISDLIESLSQIRAEQAVLISTIAVLESFDGGFDETTGRFCEDVPYGRHRRELEVAISKLYPRTLIVRLPALFGADIKKNFVFDLMNPVPSMLTAERYKALCLALPSRTKECLQDLYQWSDHTEMWILNRMLLNQKPERRSLEGAVIDAGFEAARFVNPESTFQYYDLRQLSQDIEMAIDAGCDVIHLATAPVGAAKIHERLTGRSMPTTGAKQHTEDMRTIHAAHFGATGPYLRSAEEVLGNLEEWFTLRTRAQ